MVGRPRSPGIINLVARLSAAGGRSRLDTYNAPSGQQMDLRVRVLGSFEVEGLAPHKLGSRKARTLLKVLAMARGRPVGVDELIERLWPDDEGAPSRPDEQVAVLVSRLRAVLGSDRLIRTGAGYSLRYDWLDLEALGELAAEATRRLAAGSFALARAAADAALGLVRGPLLADEPDAAWVTGERGAAERVIAQTRLCAATAALNAGDYGYAANLASAILDGNPHDEAALRALMEAHAAAARPALAIAAYGVARERLSEELGVDPTPETESIYLRILRQEPLPGHGHQSGTTGRTLEMAKPVLPGRERELSVLDAALERAAAGRAELVVVEGEAGIGKTRLLQTWAGVARATGVLVLQARCDELERSLPLQPLADALDAHPRSSPWRARARARAPCGVASRQPTVSTAAGARSHRWPGGAIRGNPGSVRAPGHAHAGGIALGRPPSSRSGDARVAALCRASVNGSAAPVAGHYALGGKRPAASGTPCGAWPTRPGRGSSRGRPGTRGRVARTQWWASAVSGRAGHGRRGAPRRPWTVAYPPQAPPLSSPMRCDDCR